MKFSTKLLLTNLALLMILWYAAISLNVFACTVIFIMMIAIRVWSQFVRRAEMLEEAEAARVRVRKILEKFRDGKDQEA